MLHSTQQIIGRQRLAPEHIKSRAARVPALEQCGQRGLTPTNAPRATFDKAAPGRWRSSRARSKRLFWSAIRCARDHPRNHRSQGFQSRTLQTVLVPGPMSLTSPAPAAGWHGRVDCSLSMAEERAHTETRPEFSMVWLQPSRA